ncbi:MAG: DUF2284 domain-containing protein [bacterium]|nr:DUF2284 domain-containing protein [bacterium]
MDDRKTLEALFAQHGCTDFRWIDPKQIVVAAWVRMKCRFGCQDYGKAAACPPHLPSPTECERFFSEYQEAALFRFSKAVEKPEDRHAWTRSVNARLLKLERAVFMAGNPKAFVLFIDPCNLCTECTDDPKDCPNPQNARPSLEGLSVDVFSTVRKAGYPIEVLTDYAQEMNRYGMVMVM